jgi:hypothetical protein
MSDSLAYIEHRIFGTTFVVRDSYHSLSELFATTRTNQVTPRYSDVLAIGMGEF